MKFLQRKHRPQLLTIRRMKYSTESFLSKKLTTSPLFLAEINDQLLKAFSQKSARLEKMQMKLYVQENVLWQKLQV